LRDDDILIVKTLIRVNRDNIRTSAYTQIQQSLNQQGIPYRRHGHWISGRGPHSLSRPPARSSRLSARRSGNDQSLYGESQAIATAFYVLQIAPRTLRVLPGYVAPNVRDPADLAGDPFQPLEINEV
jgi:hypothetical protein